METLEKALGAFECKFAATNKWRLVVSFLCAAEEVAFTIQLAQSRGAGEKYHIEFLRTSGDEAMFVEIVEAVRAHCADIDNDPMLFLASKSLSAWLDGKQDLTGRRYAIKSNEASILIQEMNADLHVDTLYHVARTVKNHCRHKGNRQLFMDADRKALILGLKWMLSDSDELARYAMFILLQFAKDQTNGDSEGSAAFWSSPCERSDCVLLLDMLAARDDTADFGASWTKAMAHELQQSLIMAL
ncbi:TPA: hypothetical protein N0F65_003112 [Lagenidium giganteum]|uniref:Uncharacterized protein n=1 Tax=Lagenidium giganteum TaxID=4803 RepID=A0AAV2YWU8_9STRA|nr:TPA: hypothetical protein N0F65_003112 [Lagenidium giganteum]